MSEFITGKKLIDAVDEIIWEAKDVLLLVSPYIKLDEHFKELFKDHLHNEKLHIIIVFGKNEKDVSKSLSKKDFEFFQQFPKVSIVYAPKLHGKYYGNEKKGVVTSINLYDFSFTNENIEFGVFSELSFLDKLSITSSNAIDTDAYLTCLELAEKSEPVFIKRPIYKNKKLIVNIGKSYINKSDVLLDNTKDYYGFSRKKSSGDKKLMDFPEEVIVGGTDNQRPERVLASEKVVSEPKLKESKKETGYCIRTGEEIPFNPEQPMSKTSWRVWNKYGDLSFPEQYCHKTGEKSNGKTSMEDPILR
jgi:hypothetical protein